jgi:hypothetical protein
MLKDEEIAEQKYQERRKRYSGIETGIYSGDEFIEFLETCLFEQVNIMLPASFHDMPADEARRKYPSEQRPQIIKTNREGTIDFGFNLLDETIEEEQLESVAHDFVRVMKRLYPRNLCLKVEKGQGISFPYAAVEFISTAIDGSLYNMVVLMSIKGKMMQMLFNCPCDRKEDWAGCLLQIREKISEYEEEPDETDQPIHRTVSNFRYHRLRN